MSRIDPAADPVRDAARIFVARHQGEHLAGHRIQLVHRCATHLADSLGVAHERAQQVALQVLGELESRGTAAWVDLSISTSHAVFVRDPASGNTVAFTAADLIAVARAQGTRLCPQQTNDTFIGRARTH